MQQWICCPVCGKRLIVKMGSAQIEGGSIGAWCKPCKRTIVVYGNCKTRFPSGSEESA